MSDAAVSGPGLPGRARRVLINVAILAAVLVVGYFAVGLQVSPLLIGVLLAAIALPLVFPARYEDLASAIGWLGLAAFFYLYAKAELWALICGVIGVFSLLAAVATLRGQGSARRT